MASVFKSVKMVITNVQVVTNLSLPNPALASFQKQNTPKSTLIESINERQRRKEEEMLRKIKEEELRKQREEELKKQREKEIKEKQEEEKKLKERNKSASAGIKVYNPHSTSGRTNIKYHSVQQREYYTYSSIGYTTISDGEACCVICVVLVLVLLILIWFFSLTF